MIKHVEARGWTWPRQVEPSSSEFDQKLAEAESAAKSDCEDVCGVEAEGILIKDSCGDSYNFEVKCSPGGSNCAERIKQLIDRFDELLIADDLILNGEHTKTEILEFRDESYEPTF